MACEVLGLRLVGRVVAQRERRHVDRLLLRHERLVLDVAHEPALVGPSGLGRPLDRRGPADDRLGLQVLQVRLAAQRAERVGGVGDHPLVAAVARPLVARGVGLLAPRRRPQRQAVVGDVAVEVDEARIDHPARAHLARAVEARRRRRGARLHGGDQLVGADVHRPVVDLGLVLVEGHDAAGEDEWEDPWWASLRPARLHGELLVAEREHDRLAAVGARRDGQRRLGVVGLELGHRHVAPAERRREVAHGAGQVGDAADRRRDLGLRGVDVEGRQLAHVGQLRRRGVELDRVGEVHDAIAEVDLDRRQARAVDHRRALARLAVDDRHRPHGARAVQELAQGDDDRVERPDGADELDGVLVHLFGELAGRERDRAQLALAHDGGLDGAPMRSTVIARCRSSAPARRMPSSSTSRSSARSPARSAGEPSTTSMTSTALPRPRRPATRGGSGRGPTATPSQARRTRPSAMRAETIRRVASLMGTARPRPTPATAVLMPTTRPEPSTSAPPELPGFSAASVCTTFSTRRRGPPRRPTGSERPSAETTPAVTEPA